MSSFGVFSFQVVNTVAFGDKIVWNSNYHPSTNQIILPIQTAINQLAITLLDCDLQPLKTVIANQNDIETTMLLSVFDQ